MNSSEKEGTTNKISLSLDLNVKDGNNFCAGVSIQLCWNFKPYCFNFFPKSALLNWGCDLSMDAAYTRTFTVYCVGGLMHA